MLELGLGLTAACAWAVHDLLVRKIGQHTALLPMLVMVLAAGAVALLLPVAALADWQAMTAPAFGYAALAGLAYVLGLGGLYRAFSLAPVRLVAPILGAFPMISLGFAAMGGKTVSWVEILAVLAIVGGIAGVALTGRDGGRVARPGTAILWSLAGSLGFATTFWLAQEAGRQGDELVGILITRLVALVVVLGIAAAQHAPIRNLRGVGRTLAMMGVMDALAIALVTLSARMPNPEYASISSSLFGVLTILLASWFLNERVSHRQWLGILVVFAGVGLLSAQG